MSRQPPLVLANPLTMIAATTKRKRWLWPLKRDVDFKAIDFSKLRYPPLPGRAEEAKALSALMPDARVLTGADATETALKQSRSPRSCTSPRTVSFSQNTRIKLKVAGLAWDGLRCALVLAGSESQAMSLWQVSDAARRDLRKGYSRLQRGEGRTEALRQVQLEMIRDDKRKHPFY